MDSKFAKYINSRYGFVVAYHICKKETKEDDKLQVWTPSTKISQPHEEKATKERVSYFENRNKNQYQIIFENKNEIIKNKNKKIRGIIYPLTGLLTTASFFLRSINIPLLYTMSCLICGITLVTISEIAIILIKEKFEKELKLYQDFLENSEQLEQREEQDKNITNHLNENTKKLITENKQLKDEGYIENIFNTRLMESIELKELRELLLRYKISMALEEPQSFRIPGEKIESKKRTLTKEKIYVKSKYDTE